jgi:sRNA-binding regulator protein Hfq
MANHSAFPTSRDDEALDNGEPHLPEVAPSGPRKLIRPSLRPGAADARGNHRRDVPTLLAHAVHAEHSNAANESSHAEAFYFQKQMQLQTHMVFMLESGERVEGCIEWYDRNAIKVRHGSTRTLIYKSAIKYIYKAGENSHP